MSPRFCAGVGCRPERWSPRRSSATQAINGWGAINAKTGVIIESRHALQGVSLAGKVLVFPGAKGASGWSGQFHIARINQAQPAAFVFNKHEHEGRARAWSSHASLP